MDTGGKNHVAFPFISVVIGTPRQQLIKRKVLIRDHRRLFCGHSVTVGHCYGQEFLKQAQKYLSRIPLGIHVNNRNISFRNGDNIFNLMNLRNDTKFNFWYAFKVSLTN